MADATIRAIARASTRKSPMPHRLVLGQPLERHQQDEGAHPERRLAQPEGALAHRWPAPHGCGRPSRAPRRLRRCPARALRRGSPSNASAGSAAGAPGPAPSERTTTMTRTIARLLFGALLLLPLGAAAQDDFTSSFRLQDCRFPRARREPPLHPRAGAPARLRRGGTRSSSSRCSSGPAASRSRSARAGAHHPHGRIVEERETEDGEIKEISRNFFAHLRQDAATSSTSARTSTSSRTAGSSATTAPGWPGRRRRAARHHHARHVPARLALLPGGRAGRRAGPGGARAEGLEVETEAGDFEDASRSTETTPLDAGAESTKVYCPGVGLVADNDLRAGRNRRRRGGRRLEQPGSARAAGPPRRARRARGSAARAAPGASRSTSSTAASSLSAASPAAAKAGLAAAHPLAGRPTDPAPQLGELRAARAATSS